MLVKYNQHNNQDKVMEQSDLMRARTNTVIREDKTQTRNQGLALSLICTKIS